MMKIEALMTREVETCRPTDSLSRAAELMWDHDCGCLPVVDESGRVIGMITDRDVCMAAYTRGEPLEGVAVSAAMSKQLFSCRPRDTVRDAESIMKGKRVRRLPVVDADGRLVGLISLNDIAREAERESAGGAKAVGLDEVALTLGAICAPRGPRQVMASA